MSTKQYKGITIVLLALLLASITISICFGAIHIRLEEIFSAIGKLNSSGIEMTLNERIFIDIRLPRALLCVFVGASLVVGGVLMQGLFRNPIVEPGLVGTSSGAAFGAALYFVLGAVFQFSAGEWILPFAASAGAICSTFLVFTLSRSLRAGQGSVTTLLLTGIAVNALFLSGVGFLSYIARDPQARSITFWSMGTLSGANWHSVQIVGFTAILCIALSLRFARQLNTLMLGEEEAYYLGTKIRRLKISILLINVLMIATATAFVGVIGFVGLIVPHFLRMLKGSDHRFLILHGALLGAILLSIADVISRTLFSPAELPIGIVTSFVGVPVFIYLLRKGNYLF